MEYVEYKKILDAAMIDYVNSGGSVYYKGNVVKEYFFVYEDDDMSYDKRCSLDNKAIIAIMDNKALPSGIRLKKCIWHRKDG